MRAGDGINKTPLYSVSARKVRYRHVAFYAAVLLPGVVWSIFRDDGLLFQVILIATVMMIALVLPFLVYLCVWSCGTTACMSSRSSVAE